MHISEVLQRKGSYVATIAPDVTVRELVAMLATENIGAVVVSQDGETIDGIASERDIVRALESNPQVLDDPVSSIMTAVVTTCVLEDTVDELMRMMTEFRVRHVPVKVDGKLAGIISIGDVVLTRIQEVEFEREQL
jgi:CBS domain-containing protein